MLYVVLSIESLFTYFWLHFSDSSVEGLNLMLLISCRDVANSDQLGLVFKSFF